MKLIKLVRNKKDIVTVVQKPNDDGHLETYDITSHEAPHPQMDVSLEALAPIVRRVMEFKSVAGINAYSLSLSHTKHGTRSATIGFTRNLNITKKDYRTSTVSFRIDDPAQDEEGERECNKAETDVIDVVVSEAIRYHNGERQQMLLGELEAEPSKGEDAPEEPGLFDAQGEHGDPSSENES